MKKVHVAFANERFYKSLDILERTSNDIGKVDEFVSYRPSDLHANNFWEENQSVLSHLLVSETSPIGAGYWIWKPFIILETMKKLDDGDIVLYTDAGMKVLDNLNPLFDITKTSKDNRMLFEPSMKYGSHLHSTWTKRDCFVLMDLDGAVYWNARMLHAAFSVWMKTSKNIEFLSEWQRYLTDTRIVTDEPNTCGKPNFPDFKQHRWDQAVLSLLSLKYGRELYREPTQFSNNEKRKFPNSPYSQLFDHHGGDI
jgi:hypothetical protein